MQQAVTIIRISDRVDDAKSHLLCPAIPSSTAGQPSRPTPTRAAGVTWEHPLAQLFVPANPTHIYTDIADRLGSWWEERRSIIQPSEFVVDAGGKVMASSYSDGPIGRMDAADVVRMIKFREAQQRK